MGERLASYLGSEKDKSEEAENEEYPRQHKTATDFSDCHFFVFGFHSGDRQPVAGNKTESSTVSNRLYPVCTYGSGPRNAK